MSPKPAPPVDSRPIRDVLGKLVWIGNKVGIDTRNPTQRYAGTIQAYDVDVVVLMTVIGSQHGSHRLVTIPRDRILTVINFDE